MITAKNIGKTIALAVVFGVALYAVVYFMASHSEAFEFVEQKIKSSRAITAQIGEIKKIKPSLLGAYDQKTVNSDEWTSMTLDVTGTTRTMQLDVKAKKTNGTWALESARSGEEKFDLN